MPPGLLRKALKGPVGYPAQEAGRKGRGRPQTAAGPGGDEAASEAAEDRTSAAAAEGPRRVGRRAASAAAAAAAFAASVQPQRAVGRALERAAVSGVRRGPKPTGRPPTAAAAAAEDGGEGVAARLPSWRAAETPGDASGSVLARSAQAPPPRRHPASGSVAQRRRPEAVRRLAARWRSRAAQSAERSRDGRRASDDDE